MPARVLFVDDDVHNLEIYSLFLSRVGTRLGATIKLEVTVASNGDDALELLREDGPFDLVVTDLLMPGLDGCSLIRAIASGASELGSKPTSRLVPTILVTVDPLNVSCRSEVTARMQKPVDLRELRELMLTTIERYWKTRTNVRTEEI